MIPASVEWFANLANLRTRRAYQGDIENFCQFVCLRTPKQFREVTRAHVLAWRRQFEQRGLSETTQRRTLAPRASLFDHLLENSALVGGNPVQGGKRPKLETTEGKTRRWPITRPRPCSRRPIRRRSKVNVTGRFSPCCCITACVVRKPPACRPLICSSAAACAQTRQGRQAALRAAGPGRR